MIEGTKRARFLIDCQNGKYIITCFVGTAENETLQWGYGSSVSKAVAKKIAYLNARSK